MDQGIGTAGSLTVLGIDFTYSRGVSPSTGLMKLVPLGTFDRFVDDLTLSFGGSSQTLTDVAVASCPLELFEGRESFRWNCAIQDRRWRWRYPRISGTYNRRLCDGSVDEKGKKTAQELGELLAAELDDTIDVTELPTDAYPSVFWEDALARFELAWLCDLFGLTVCPKTDNTFVLEPVTQTASLPAGGNPITPPAFSSKPAIIPSAVRVTGSHDRKQGWIDLVSVAVDIDGKIDVINNMSYNPGWGSQWPNVFPDVAEAYRHLAFEYVHRLFVPSDPTIVLDDHVLELGTDVTAGRKRCLDPQVKGIFFSHDDFGTTTGSDAIYTGKFTVRKDWNAVLFHYPVYQISSGAILPAELSINTGYHIITSDGQAASYYTKDKAVPEAKKTTKPRVLRHPELSKTYIETSLYGTSTGSNSAALDVEADAYLDPVAATYSFQASQDVLYDRLIFTDLSGAIAQIKWRLGNGRVATTRIGLNQEVDIYSIGHQQRRAQERLSQMAERMRV